MGKIAIILGATGLTGGILLDKLLNDNRYKKVKIFNRNSVGITHFKLEEFIVDLLDFDAFETNFQGDEIFCCIGTTLKKTPDKSLYKKIDYGIPVTASKMAAKNGIGTFLVISAMGADADSKLFYNRTKGEMERDVLKQNIKNTFILQPSLISGKREEKRFGEYFGKLLMSVINPLLIGGLKKYQSIHFKIIANAMIFLANSKKLPGRYTSDKLKKLGS